MGLLGDTSKGIILLAVVIGIFLMFEFIEINQIAIAMFLLIGLMISISIVAFGYWKNRRKKGP